MPMFRVAAVSGRLAFDEIGKVEEEGRFDFVGGDAGWLLALGGGQAEDETQDHQDGAISR